MAGDTIGKPFLSFQNAAENVYVPLTYVAEPMRLGTDCAAVDYGKLAGDLRMPARNI